MDDLIKAYIDIVNEYNPYWECYEDTENVIEIELPEMLYNLEQINKELTESLSAEFDKDLFTLQERLKAVIKQFKAKGVVLI